MSSDGAVVIRPDYLGVLRRQFLVLAGCLVAGVLLVGFLLTSLPKAYGSSASVLVEETNSNTASSDARTVGALNMDTEAQVIKSAQVASIVKSVTGSPLSTEELSKGLTVSVPPNTTVLAISYQASSPRTAQAVTQAFADAYLKFRNDQSAAMIESQVERLDKLASDTSAAIEASNRRILTLPKGSATRITAEQNLSQQRSRLKWIERQLLPLDTNPAPAGEVLVSAPLDKNPVKPSKLMVGGSTLTVFGMLGLVLAWWRDGRRGLIRSARQLEDELAVEVLGVVDRTELADVDSDPRSVQHYRKLVHAAVGHLHDPAGRILVAGVGDHSLAEDVATTFGAELARTGTGVLVVYSDPAAASVLGGALAGHSVQARGGLDYTSLPAAKGVASSDQSRELPRFFAHVADDRQIVLATPPTGLSADAQALSTYADVILLVVRLDESTRSDVAEALRQFQQVGVTNVGAIAITPRSRRRRSRRRSRRSDRHRWLERRVPTRPNPPLVPVGSGVTRPSSLIAEAHLAAGHEVPDDLDPAQEGRRARRRVVRDDEHGDEARADHRNESQTPSADVDPFLREDDEFAEEFGREVDDALAAEDDREHDVLDDLDDLDDVDEHAGDEYAVVGSADDDDDRDEEADRDAVIHLQGHTSSVARARMTQARNGRRSTLLPVPLKRQR